jgi:FMN phosphatase YigB (HAD superfamily)
MLRSVGEAIYTQRSEPYEDVFPALKKFSSYAECLIFTTGDVDVQERRLKEAQLLHYFDNVFVTRVKGPVSYGEILKSVTRPELRKIYSIGNSLTMDLLPAKKLMIECLHIVRPEDTGNEIAVPATDMKMLEEVKKINSLEDAFDHIEQECGNQESSVIVAKTPRIIVI